MNDESKSTRKSWWTSEAPYLAAGILFWVTVILWRQLPPMITDTLSTILSTAALAWNAFVAALGILFLLSPAIGIIGGAMIIVWRVFNPQQEIPITTINYTIKHDETSNEWHVYQHRGLLDRYSTHEEATAAVAAQEERTAWIEWQQKDQLDKDNDALVRFFGWGVLILFLLWVASGDRPPPWEW